MNTNKIPHLNVQVCSRPCFANLFDYIHELNTELLCLALFPTLIVGVSCCWFAPAVPPHCFRYNVTSRLWIYNAVEQGCSHLRDYQSLKMIYDKIFSCPLGGWWCLLLKLLFMSWAHFNDSLGSPASLYLLWVEQLWWRPVILKLLPNSEPHTCMLLLLFLP